MTTEATPITAQSVESPEEEMTEAEERISVASAGQLMWWRFRKHTLAMISAVVLIVFYLVVIFAPSLAYVDPELSEAQRGLMPPQKIHWFHGREAQPACLRRQGRPRSQDLQARLRHRSGDKNPGALLCQGLPLYAPGLCPR